MEQDIIKIIDCIWVSMLQLPVEKSEGLPCSSEDKISACIQITGDWLGTVALECGVSFASQAAGAMLGLDPQAAVTADLRDTMGELANMIGGNIKALLPGDNHLSLPIVVEGHDHVLNVPGSKLLYRVPLRSASHEFSVSLLQTEPMVRQFKAA